LVKVLNLKSEPDIKLTILKDKEKPSYNVLEYAAYFNKEAQGIKGRRTIE
jgi:hypothetical protein